MLSALLTPTHCSCCASLCAAGQGLDFFVYSPGSMVYFHDMIKYQLACTQVDLQKLPPHLDTNSGYPASFGSNWSASAPSIELKDKLCIRNSTAAITASSDSAVKLNDTRCWNNVVHYKHFTTQTPQSSDGNRGGYILSKEDTYKTCDVYVSPECVAQKGANQCVIEAIEKMLGGSIDPAPPSPNPQNTKLVIALSAVLGSEYSLLMWQKSASAGIFCL